MTTDIWGYPLSNASSDTARRFTQAIGLMNAYQADPIAEIDGLLAEHPDFIMGHAFRAAALALTTDKVFQPEMARSVAAAESLASQANARERAHIAALRAWHDGDPAKAAETWGRIAIDYPRDIIAIQFAQLSDFCLGYSHMLRDRVARVMPQWSAAVPHYGFVLGMYAFGLEETGDFAAAEQHGREAVALNPQDAWAAHAVAHVMEMQGRIAEGKAWLQDTAAGWAPGGLFAFHNWWHLALLHIEAGDAATALRLFDDKIAAGGFPQALELIDGTAMLWRLSALGHDVGSRWQPIAEKWLDRIEDGLYAFNDLHAMMSFCAAGWVEPQTHLLRAMEAAAASGLTNGMMTREVGLPAARAMRAFSQGRYAEAAVLLLPLQGKSNRFGGSHAQRDIFSWTLMEAAIRMGDRLLAEAMLAERQARKPGSPLVQAWSNRVRQLANRQAAE